MEQTVRDRLILYLQAKKIGRNKFEKKAGLSLGYITSLKSAPGSDKLVDILTAAEDLNEQWLLTGEGEMLKQQAVPATTAEEKQSLPLIPVNAMAGALTGQADPIMLYDCEQYIIPIFHGAEFLIRVQGDSMMPKYMPGDLVACKHVPMDHLWFQWGKDYVIDTIQGALIKRIEQSDKDGCLLIVSENDKYKPFTLPADEINGIAIVVGTIRVG